MTPRDILAKFAYSLDHFEPIDGQLSNSDLTRILEAVAPLLLRILYEKLGAIHNLIGLIRTEAAYVAHYGAEFPETARVGAYDPSINNDDTSIVRAHTEAAHKAKRTDCVTYDTAQRETTQFVLAVVADTWFRELQDMETLYTDISPKDLPSRLQAGCTGRHDLDLLAPHNEIQRYRLEVKGIHGYNNMIKDTQKQGGRAGRTIDNETLLLSTTTIMSTTEIFPYANKEWEDRVEPDKTWTTGRQAYKKAHTKVRIKEIADEGTVKFGAANSAAHQETTQNMENKQAVDNGVMKALEGYFGNLDIAAINEKLVLEKLVANNTKLAANNESLVAMVKKLTVDIKNLERDNTHLKKLGQRSWGRTICHHFKMEVYHAPEACYKLAKKKTSAPLVGESCCDGVGRSA